MYFFFPRTAACDALPSIFDTSIIDPRDPGDGDPSGRT
jgi:hypothetical protein